MVTHGVGSGSCGPVRKRRYGIRSLSRLAHDLVVCPTRQFRSCTAGAVGAADGTFYYEVLSDGSFSEDSYRVQNLISGSHILKRSSVGERLWHEGIRWHHERRFSSQGSNGCDYTTLLSKSL